MSACARVQESALLRLAERQAGREGELAAERRRAAALEAELGDLQREVELRQEQEAALKEARPPFRVSKTSREAIGSGGRAGRPASCEAQLHQGQGAAL